MNLVSIIIPCYNYGRYVSEAIESALAQTYPETEIIVLDDGSSDDTPERVRKYEGRLRYLRTPNQGHGATLNLALRHARGEYYVCLDADNALMPAFVARTVAMLDEAPASTAFVYTQRIYFGTRSGVSRAPRYDLDRLKERNFIDTCSLVRTRCGQKFGYDVTLKAQADYDFFLTLAENGYQGILLDEPLFRYRVHDVSRSQVASQRYLQLEVIKPILKKHASLYSRSDRRRAIKEARNRIQMAIIHNRRPERTLPSRMTDFLALLSAGAGPMQLWNQFRYLLSPGLFSPVARDDSR